MYLFDVYFTKSLNSLVSDSVCTQILMWMIGFYIYSQIDIKLSNNR